MNEIAQTLKFHSSSGVEFVDQLEDQDQPFSWDASATASYDDDDVTDREIVIRHAEE